MVLEGSYELRERLACYRELVARAVKNRRIFRIVSAVGDFVKLRAELFNRKFVEQIVVPRYSPLHDKTLMQLVEGADEGNDCEKALIARLLGDTKANFIWSPKLQYYELFHGTCHLNRVEFIGDNFTVKDGMIECVKKIDEGVEPEQRLKYPRAFDLTADEGPGKFFDEYDWTMVTSLILYLNDDRKNETLFSDRHWTLTTDGLRMALRLVMSKVDEIELGTPAKQLSKHHWRLIRQTYHAIIDLRQRMLGSSNIAEHYLKKVHEASAYILKYWPERQHDGFKNIWLVKPTASGQGEGIIVTNDTKRMLRYVGQDNRSYVVQKYIERPLLIYGVKFDIRQYMLIEINENTFCGWAHPLCTFKLASENFTLHKLTESVHITNTTIQQKYTNKASAKLTDHHMWSLDDFNQYCAKIGQENLYSTQIFPSMKNTLKRICEACSEDIEWRTHRFELLGEHMSVF